jgi:hypothetical protein
MNSAVIKSLQIFLLARELTVFHDLLFDTLVAHLGPFSFHKADISSRHALLGDKQLQEFMAAR